MSTTNGDEYELVEIPVQKKIEINITLDDLLDAVAQQAGSLTSGARQPPPHVLDRLRQLSQLARQVRGQLGQPDRPGQSD